MLKRVLIAAFFIIFSAIVGAGVFLMEKDWVDFSALDAYKTVRPSVILDDEGAELARFELDKRATISYDKIPLVVIKAFVAAEDHGFFEHYGISLRGILRSTFVNLYHWRKVQGASTITQQLARGMFLSYERTWSRKFQEVLLALQLERQLSKEQILELYLNNMYFGRGIYGVEAAAKRFWNISLETVTLDQAATLAAVAKSARLYSPLNAPGNAKRRRDVVLQSMYNLDLITKDEYKKAIARRLQIQDFVPGNPIRLYLQEWIRVWAEQQFGKEALYTKGLRIKTTINKGMQEKAEAAFRKVMTDLRVIKGPALNGGMISIEPESGQIKVVVGGYDFKQSQFNRVFQARRQMGSSFKPIIYALAMKAGIEMDSVFVDEPYELTLPRGDVWRPTNWDDSFDGPMTLARALTLSNNIITIKLFLKIGAEYVIPWARLFGINNVSPYPSAALGTAEVTAEENVAAFNVFANNGMYVKPQLIEWVKDEAGNKLWECEPATSVRVIDTRLTSKMVNLLSLRMLMVQRRDGVAGWFDADAIGKSGSTNGSATSWFVGATPSLTTAVYVGRDDNKPIGLLSGRTAYPLWLSFYKSLKFNKKHFYSDPNLQEYAVNWITGQPSSDRDNPDVVVLLK